MLECLKSSQAVLGQGKGSRVTGKRAGEGGLKAVRKHLFTGPDTIWIRAVASGGPYLGQGGILDFGADEEGAILISNNYMLSRW